jgi:flagellar biosynthesis/type III secretory pathway protein FliH
MALLPRERLGEVVSVNFGDSNRSAPKATEWAVGGGGAQAQAAAVERTQSPAQPEPAVQPAPVAEPMPIHNAEPPVFEISEDILRAFYEEAIATGLEDGKGQVFAELNILQERYAGAIEQLRSAGQQLAGQNQTQIIKLACFMAEKIVRSHLKLNPSDLMSMVQEAVDAQSDVGVVTVMCSSGDHEFLKARLDSMTGPDGSLLKVNLKQDELLEYGDFRVETKSGNIDGRVNDRVNQVAQMVTGGDGA